LYSFYNIIYIIIIIVVFIAINIMIVLMQVRLLMSYVITHPEKMDDARQQQWQRLAHLTDMDMNTINNLELLGVPVKKRGNTKSGIGLTFGRKRKRAVRKVFCQSGQSWVCMSAQVLGGGGGCIAYLGHYQLRTGSVPWGNPKFVPRAWQDRT